MLVPHIVNLDGQNGICRKPSISRSSLPYPKETSCHSTLLEGRSALSLAALFHMWSTSIYHKFKTGFLGLLELLSGKTIATGLRVRIFIFILDSERGEE